VLCATPLHLCAASDNETCAKILLKHKAKVCVPCPNGFLPIHVAAMKSSIKVLNLLLEEAVKLGISKEKMLNFTDADNNKPLHSAVKLNNIEAVDFCLNNGSTIDETSLGDLATPVHAACAQGSLDILKLMLKKQFGLKIKVLQMQDINKMTPLHKASMFDHVEVVDYLIKNGADINTRDQEKRSPLLLAASRNCVKVVCYLLDKNADFKLRDMKLRNFLHLIVSQTKPIEKSDSSRPNSSDGNNQNSNNSITIHSLHEVSKVLIKVIS
jgi:transient receptor potential cation channel subfamily A protein 1